MGEIRQRMIAEADERDEQLLKHFERLKATGMKKMKIYETLSRSGLYRNCYNGKPLGVRVITQICTGHNRRYWRNQRAIYKKVQFQRERTKKSWSRHDLQRLSAEKFAKITNDILAGERSLANGY